MPYSWEQTDECQRLNEEEYESGVLKDERFPIKHKRSSLTWRFKTASFKSKRLELLFKLVYAIFD